MKFLDWFCRLIVFWFSAWLFVWVLFAVGSFFLAAPWQSFAFVLVCVIYTVLRTSGALWPDTPPRLFDEKIK